MSNYINIKDYDASVHREVLDAVTRSDEAVIEICEDRAIEEMCSYLSQRYDCDTLFAARGTERQTLVLMMALDIAIYHIFCIHNPAMLSQVRKDRYARAVEWLKAVRRGDVVVNGLPPLVSDDGNKGGDFLFHSNPKRNNHF